MCPCAGRLQGAGKASGPRCFQGVTGPRSVSTTRMNCSGLTVCGSDLRLLEGDSSRSRVRSFVQGSPEPALTPLQDARVPHAAPGTFNTWGSMPRTQSVRQRTVCTVCSRAHLPGEGRPLHRWSLGLGTRAPGSGQF